MASMLQSLSRLNPFQCCFGNRKQEDDGVSEKTRLLPNEADKDSGVGSGMIEQPATAPIPVVSQQSPSQNSVRNNSSANGLSRIRRLSSSSIIPFIAGFPVFASNSHVTEIASQQQDSFTVLWGRDKQRDQVTCSFDCSSSSFEELVEYLETNHQDGDYRILSEKEGEVLTLYFVHNKAVYKCPINNNTEKVMIRLVPDVERKTKWPTPDWAQKIKLDPL